MKLSLKGFFLHEALGDEGSSSSRGKGKPKPPPPPPPPPTNESASGEHVVAYDETGRGDMYGEAVEVGRFPSYDAAAQWIESKTNGPGDSEAENFLIYPIEDWTASASDTSKMGTFQEHQDPTAVVDAGSTIWSDPEQPVDVKKFSNRGGNLHIDLCEVFGMEEATPDDWKASGRNTTRSHGNYSYQKNSAGKYRSAYSSMGNRGREEVLPGVFGDPNAATDASTRHHQNIMSLRGMQPTGTGNMQRPDGRVHKNMVRPANTGRGRGVFESDLAEMFGMEEMGGPGSGRGRPKGSKNKTQDEIDAAQAAAAARTPGKRGRPVGWRKAGTTTPPPAAAPEELPDEMPAGFDDPVGADQDFGTAPDALSGSANPDGKLPPATPEDEIDNEEEIDWTNRTGIDDDSWLDDPALGKGVEIPGQAAKPAPPPPPPPPDFSRFDVSSSPDRTSDDVWNAATENGTVMSWDELSADEPGAADDFEMEIGAEEAEDSQFAAEEAGQVIHARTSDGKRYRYSRPYHADGPISFYKDKERGLGVGPLRGSDIGGWSPEEEEGFGP